MPDYQQQSRAYKPPATKTITTTTTVVQDSNAAAIAPSNLAGYELPQISQSAMLQNTVNAYQPATQYPQQIPPANYYPMQPQQGVLLNRYY